MRRFPVSLLDARVVPIVYIGGAVLFASALVGVRRRAPQTWAAAVALICAGLSAAHVMANAPGAAASLVGCLMFIVDMADRRALMRALSLRSEDAFHINCAIAMAAFATAAGAA